MQQPQQMECADCRWYTVVQAAENLSHLLNLCSEKTKPSTRAGKREKHSFFLCSQQFCQFVSADCEGIPGLPNTLSFALRNDRGILLCNARHHEH
jgi:hypothetical protein